MSAVAAFAAVSKADLRKLTRVPSFIVPTVVFPVLFFVMFALPNASRRTDTGLNVGAYMLASYGAYAMMAVALTSFAVSIATERGLGWNRLLRVTPISTGAYFCAKVVTALSIGFFALVVLFIFGAISAHITLPALVWLKLVGVLLPGMLPFVMLGFALGYLAGPTAAAPIANLIFLPLSFASGLFIPLPMLPEGVRNVAPYLPAYHLGQLGWTTLGAGDTQGMTGHVLWLLGYAVAFGALAIYAYQRDEGREFT